MARAKNTLRAVTRPDKPQTPSDVRGKLRGLLETSCGEMVARGAELRDFAEVEERAAELSRRFGALLILLYLSSGEREVSRKTPTRGFHRRPGQPRRIGTQFGVVRFFRTYWRADAGNEDRRGIHPLDSAIGLTSDGYSWGVLSRVTRLAAHVSYELTVAFALSFWNVSPSKRTVERAVLGFGAHADDYLYQMPAPEGDGEVMIAQVDSKGVPTCTEEELRRRRQPRRKGPKLSARQRNREVRKKVEKHRRPKKNPHSKNAKAATVVVVYTLKRVNGVLTGPVNKRTYVSFGAKRRAFEWLQQEVKKRGFGPEAYDRPLHLLTDGDEDLARYGKEYVPHATRTIDFMHVLEYLWDACNARYGKGSSEASQIARKCKEELLRGREDIVANTLAAMMEQAEGAKKETIETSLKYVSKNMDRMGYGWMLRHGLDIATGAVEGAVKHVVGKRADAGGMRFLQANAHALCQLRCIDINGTWEDFVEYVRKRSRGTSQPRILRAEASEIPEPSILAKAA